LLGQCLTKDGIFFPRFMSNEPGTDNEGDDAVVVAEADDVVVVVRVGLLKSLASTVLSPAGKDGDS
jgi:hypothetical protein